MLIWASFPMMLQGQCLLTEAPAQASQQQLKEVHIQKIQQE